MTNPNNCATCTHSQCNDDPELHCYMFATVPDGQCMQHTGHKAFECGVQLLVEGKLPAAARAFKEAGFSETPVTWP